MAETKVKETEVKAEEKKTEAQPKAENPKATKPKKWVVKIENGSKFCGVGAGGVQFANGEATIDSLRMAHWFEENKGYTVTAKN